MPKEFYTERDIEDLFKRGVMSLKVDENVVLTELAYEKANRLGMQLIRSQADNPPSAPVRPYISKQPVQNPAPAFSPAVEQPGADLNTRIRTAVQARLGNQVDSNLLDVIIQRVFQTARESNNHMLFGRVKGTAICSLKYAGTQGLKLLVVQPLNKRLEPVGALQVAADIVDAGAGDLCVMVRSREAALAMPDVKFVPIDLALVGVVDELDVRPDGSFDFTLRRGWQQYT